MRGSLPISIAAALVLAGCIPPSAGPPPATPANTAARPLPSPSPVAQTENRWQARPVSTDAIEIRASTYRVAPGDTLGEIARRTGSGVGAIARANGIAPPYVIRPGEELSIPAGRYHEVRSGETGIAIARAYGAQWSAVVTANGLTEPYVLRVGDRLRLPTRGEVAAMGRTERAAAFDIDIDDIITGGEPAVAEPAAQRPPPVRPASTAAGATGRFGWPLSGRIVSRFGERGSGQRNNGLDIATARGTPVRASAAGQVIYAGTEIRVHGGLVLINHGGGWITAYSNLDRLDVARGERVSRGQPIGTSGDTGLAAQPQLHFEIRRDREPVDPLVHLPRPS